MISFEGFSQMLLNFLRVPPGSSIRREYSAKNTHATELSEAITQNEYIQSVLDITRDDICIGKKPFYYDCNNNAPKEVTDIVEDKILPAFNSVVTWISRDLQSLGFSVFKSVLSNDKYFLVPVLDEIEFFLNENMELVAFITGDENPIADAVIYCNYEKYSLTKVEDSDKNGMLFKVVPTPMQLKNVEKTSAEQLSTERAIQKYRQLLSRIVRFISVDVGLSQGNKNSDVVDAVSNAINADSDTLQNMGNFTMYNDEIPIIPHRKGIGKPDYEEHIPSADISGLADLDHIMGKLNLQLRFPKSYGDFNQALSETAASTARGDIRYNRMISAIRTLVEDTTNEFLQQEPKLEEAGVVFKLSELPTPETADVVETLNQFASFVQDVWESVFSAETEKEALCKVQALEALLSGTAKLPYVTEFMQVVNSYIIFKYAPEKADEDNTGAVELNDEPNDDEEESSPDSSSESDETNVNLEDLE